MGVVVIVDVDLRLDAQSFAALLSKKTDGEWILLLLPSSLENHFQADAWPVAGVEPYMERT